MAKKRALIDAVKDPVAEKGGTVARDSKKETRESPNLFFVVGAFMVGLIGGLIVHRFFRII
jgi:hypothetical protein